MPTLTPEMAGTSLVVSWIIMGILVVFQVYMLYLNWKQGTVREKTQKMIELLKEISKKLDTR